MTITEIKESICDNYCKYPFNTETQADLNEHCAECPLNELSDGKTCEDTISRAEAQTALMMSKDVYLYIGHPTIRVSDAVQAIRDLSSVNVQRKSNADEKHVGNALKMRCEDAISRQAAIDTIDKWLESSDYNHAERNIMRATQSMLYDLPSVTQKSGKWIYDETIDNWRCSKCNETPKTMGYVGTADFMAEHFKFCNHCGAKMESEDKE